MEKFRPAGAKFIKKRENVFNAMILRLTSSPSSLA